MNNDAEIFLEVTGGNPDYTINWNSGQQTLFLDDISVGNYVVDISDINGCFTSDSITLSEPALLLLLLNLFLIIMDMILVVLANLMVLSI